VYVDHKRRILCLRVIRGHRALANDRPKFWGLSTSFLVQYPAMGADDPLPPECHDDQCLTGQYRNIRIPHRQYNTVRWRQCGTSSAVAMGGLGSGPGSCI